MDRVHLLQLCLRILPYPSHRCLRVLLISIYSILYSRLSHTPTLPVQELHTEKRYTVLISDRQISVDNRRLKVSKLFTLWTSIQRTKYIKFPRIMFTASCYFKARKTNRKYQKSAHTFLHEPFDMKFLTIGQAVDAWLRSKEVGG